MAKSLRLNAMWKTKRSYADFCHLNATLKC